MKKIYILLVFAALGLYSTAQTVSIIENPGTSGNIVVGASNYHVSESIYTANEVGPGNFLSAGSAIEQINFFINVEGVPPLVSNFELYLQNVPAGTTTFTSGAYSTAGYTLVYSGAYNAVAGTTGIAGVTLTTPFVRTAGSNLQLLIVRTDNTIHTGNNFFASVGNDVSSASNSTRRYNNTTLPVSGVTSLTASNFRPAVQFIHVFPIDASILGIGSPTVSCYNSSQFIDVLLFNEGTTNISAGAAAVTLKVSGPNSYSNTIPNAALIAPGDFEIITFNGINLNNTGDNIDSAYVNLAGDGTTYNDTLVDITTTAPILGNPPQTQYPLVEDVETTLPIFSYVELVNGDTQLWGLQTGNYTNLDQTVPLVPGTLDDPAGTTFYLFDSYSGAGSVGFISRLYSNCIAMPSQLLPNPAPVTTVRFWMSHDNVFPASLDSLYLTVSTDKGVTWTRILPGFQRADALQATPQWRQEVVDISAYNGQVIQLGFEGVSDYGNAFGLDDITISFSGIAPVSLLNFDAKRSGTVNNLTWSTSQELNSNRFVIERSTDGRNFDRIADVAAAGNSSVTRNYRFTDASPVKGINYYRLRVVDNDNSFTYSEIKNVRNLGFAEMNIAPNPVQQVMKLTLEAEKTEKAGIVITDLSGKRIYNSSIAVVAGTNTFDIPVNNFSKGTYIVMIQLSEGTMVRKINKL